MEADSSASALQLDETIDALRSTLTEDPTPENWRRDITIVGVLMALFGMVAWYATLSEQPHGRVAELEIRGELSSDVGWVSPAFTQVFSTYVQAGNRLRLRHADTLRASAALSPIPAFNVGRSTGVANWRIHIELSDTTAPAVHAKVTLSPVGGGTRSRTATLTGDANALSDLAARVALQVFDWLQIDPFSSAERRSTTAEIPQNPEVAEPYALGLRALRGGEGRLAIHYLNQALALEPDHPMLNAAVAEAYAFLGYEQRAIESISRAFEHRSNLSREKQLSIEARLKLLQNNWLEAEDLYSALTAFHPEEIAYGLSLADAQYRGSRQEQALRTLSDLRASPEFGDDPRIRLVEAYLWRRTGDWSKGADAALQAADLAEQRGFRGIMARALVAYADMDGEDGEQVLERASAVFKTIHDPYGMSLVLREMGDSLKASGHLAEAGTKYDEAIQVSMSVGNEAEIATAQQARAIVHDLKGELNAGYELKLKVLESYRRRGVDAGAAVMMENIGISLFKMGRLDEASSQFAHALEEFRIHGDLIGIAWWPYHQGRLVVRKGELAKARALFEMAIANSKEHPEGYLELHSRYELGRLDFIEQNPGAKARLAEVAAAYEAEDLMLDLGATLVLQSRLAYLDQQPTEAIGYLLRAVAIFEESDASYYLALARTQQVRMGAIDVCEPLFRQVANHDHREAALLAMTSLARCKGMIIDQSSLLAEAQELGLFEPVLALTAINQPQRARELALAQGWVAPEYWTP